MTNAKSQNSSQSDRDAQIDRGVALKPQPLRSNAARIEALAILLEEIEESGDAVLLFQISAMAMGKGQKLVGC